MAGSASQLLPCLTPPAPAPTLLSLSAPVCELINLSPFGKLDRSRVHSLMEPVLLLGQDLLCLGHWGVRGEWQQQDKLSRTRVSENPSLLVRVSGVSSTLLKTVFVRTTGNLPVTMKPKPVSFSAWLQVVMVILTLCSTSTWGLSLPFPARRLMETDVIMEFCLGN